MRSYSPRAYSVLSAIIAAVLVSAALVFGSDPKPAAGEKGHAAPASHNAAAKAPAAHNADATPPADHAAPAAGVSAEAALKMLQDGNARFLAGKSVHPNSGAARLKETAEGGQHPFATIISCADSRVPVEHLFDQGFGDLFVIRVAGNVCDVDEIGTAEYGTEHLGTQLLVVLGHTSCGAVTAVATGAQVHGHIPALVDNIKPAVAAAQKKNPELHGKDLVPAAIEANVWQSVEDLLRGSEIVRELVTSGKLQVVGAICDIADGKIQWLGAHPLQKQLISEASAEAGAPAGHTAKPENKPGTTSEAARKMLQDGNLRFLAGTSNRPHTDAARLKELAEAGQQPFATVVSCADSRVPVEFLFDQGFGDVFVIRVAGNVCAEDEIGTVEYGTDHLGTPLLVVMGHTSCGAVTAVATGAEVHGHITALVDNIKPAVARAQEEHPELHGKDLVPAAIEANVWQSIEDLLRHSEIVRERIECGKLEAVGAICDIANGKVKWLGLHPMQKRLIIEGKAAAASLAKDHPTTTPAGEVPEQVLSSQPPAPPVGAKPAEHH
jgi:carbonic anhydrase